jgi:tripartite-type tricarboxylate transporter receptor subunit TctC
LHIASEKLKLAANINLTYVPYSGTAPAITALLGAHVTSMIRLREAAAGSTNFLPTQTQMRKASRSASSAASGRST